MSFKILPTKTYEKIGVNEVEGLMDAMKATLEPVRLAIKEHIYWSEVELQDSEYKSRDGFYAHSHNLGGPEIVEIIPKCEENNFRYLSFGEYDFDEDPECGGDQDGYLDAKLRVWFKLESIENNTLKFYLYMGGGNEDAPYFRTKHEATIFEVEFTSKSVAGIKRAAAPHIKKLLKIIGGK